MTDFENQQAMYSLLQEYYLRDLTKDEMERLNGALGKDKELQRAFLEMARDDLIIHKVSRQALNRKVESPRKKAPISMRKMRAMAAAFTFLLGGLAMTYLLLTQSASVLDDTSPVVEERYVAQDAVAKVVGLYVIEDDVVSVVNKGRLRALQLGSEVCMGDLVTTPKGAFVELEYLEDHTHIHFEQESTFEVVQTEGAKHIRLEQGKLRADVAKQPVDQPMMILTKDSEAVVLGTVFELYENELTRLAVSSGRVQMKSVHDDESVYVDGGFYTEQTDGALQTSKPFVEKVFRPVSGDTLNCTEKHLSKLIVADPQRNYRGLLVFDLDDFEGEVIEATLRLRVVRFGQDTGGEGCLRAFSMATSDPAVLSTVRPEYSSQLASYQGRVGAGMQMVLELDSSKIKRGKNTILLMMDEGGNDFGFNLARGNNPPRLEIKIAPDD